MPHEDLYYDEWWEIGMAPPPPAPTVAERGEAYLPGALAPPPEEIREAREYPGGGIQGPGGTQPVDLDPTFRGYVSPAVVPTTSNQTFGEQQASWIEKLVMVLMMMMMFGGGQMGVPTAAAPMPSGRGTFYRAPGW